MIITKGLILNAKNNPEQLAILDGEYRFTYQELAERTAKLKEALKSSGIKKGDRVGILLLNTFRYLELLYAVTAIGAIAVPLNTRLSLEELEFIIKDSEQKLLFIHPEYIEYVPHFKEKTPFIQEYILVEDEKVDSDYRLYEELIESEDVTQLTYDDIHEDDVAFIFYTGGTTGRAKGVMLTHRNQVSNFYHISFKCRYNEWTNYLHAGPMFHLADCGKSIGVTWAGGVHSFLRTFTTKGFLQAVEKYRPTVISLIPTMMNMVMNDPDFKKYDLSSLEKISYGASPMPTELLKKIAKEFPGIEFYQSYGMTEASPVLTILEAKDHVIDGSEKEERRLSSVGQNAPGVELRVVDANGNDVEVGQVGEVIARGPNIMKGYWNLPEETALAIRDGWYYSGDMATIDEDQFIYIVDRKKDMIITGGENVYSAEVESVIYRHPAVLEVAVIGIPDPKWGEAVKAIVVEKTGTTLTEKDVIAFCRKSLANYKVPKSVDIVNELPKNAAGKILKRALREKYWKNTQKSVN